MNKLFRLIPILFIMLAVAGCSQKEDSEDQTGSIDYRAEMRTFIREISEYAKTIDPSFIVIPQNGNELLLLDENSGVFADDYIASIDGIGREDLYFGYTGDNLPTPATERDYMIGFLDLAENNGVEVLVTDYCSTPANVDSSCVWNNNKGYISFAADHRELDDIPVYPVTPFNINTDDVDSLPAAKNFLYLLNDELLADKAEFLSALQNTDYDLIIMDLFYDGTLQFTPEEITSLKTKAGGGQRLVIAYMSIGEAEDYRYYWQPGWMEGSPSWIVEENPDWQGNFIVKYWEEEWQQIIFGNSDAYLTKIIDSEFDGVYLDIVDAFEYFE